MTFLFSDIEGSTRRWEADPVGMRAALAAHDEVLRAAVEGRGGWLFKHTGDGVVAAFSVAADAVGAAVDAQLLLGLPVRMGLATGEAQQRDGDYFGAVLSRAARVMAAGHGGQVLVASSTAALLGSQFGLRDLGERRLRDLLGVERVFQVLGEGLRSEFPSLRTLDSVPGNLPVQVSSFVGREVEVKELVELVRGHRLVTLTGVGGVGKTRLGVQVAAELVLEFPDGVWLVELAPVAEGGAVVGVVAGVLGVSLQGPGGVSGAEQVGQALAGRRVLLVLDNCEHVLDGVADLVSVLVGRTESVKVLATSREGLRVGGEWVWPVPSLGVVGGVRSAAVELFGERARAVNPGFDVEGELGVVVEICERLDGIALAIELAAARVRSMGVADVRDRLGDRFRLLSGGRRGLERHQTLRHTVAWSYDLLGDGERGLLNRCSSFAGGFDLEAAVAVAGEDADEFEVLDLLDSLVGKSLVTGEQSRGYARYGLLETIRQYAEEQLAASGEIADAHGRHARHYAQRARENLVLWDGPRQRQALDWLEAEFANLRKAFDRSLDHDLATAALLTVAAVPAQSVQMLEPIEWAIEVLRRPGVEQLSIYPWLLRCAGGCYLLGRADEALQFLERAASLRDDAGYEAWPIVDLVEVDMNASAAVLGRRDLDEMEHLIEVLLGTDAARGAAAAFVGLSLTRNGSNGAARARVWVQQISAAARRHGNPRFIVYSMLAEALALAGEDPRRARELLTNAYDYSSQYGRFDSVLALRDLARLEELEGNWLEALQLLDRCVAAFRAAGDVPDMLFALGLMAKLAAQAGDHTTAATIVGFLGNPDRPMASTVRSDVMSGLEVSLGPQEFARRSAEGQQLDAAALAALVHAAVGCLVADAPAR